MSNASQSSTGPVSVSDCRIFELENIGHENGSIAVVQNSDYDNFVINRVFYIYDIPSGSKRGGHAHRQTAELIVALAGSFSVVLYDGSNTTTVTLDRPDRGLYVPPGIWLNLEDFSSGSVCLVMCDDVYIESDYIHDMSTFESIKKQ